MAKRRMKTADALQLGIERERGAARFYNQAAGSVKDTNTVHRFELRPR